MNFYLHPSVLLTPALAIFLYFAGYRLSAGIESPSKRVVLAAAAMAACIPGLSLIFHFQYISEIAYINFRSVPYVELSAAAWGFLFGVIAIKKKFASQVFGGLYSAFFLVMLCALVMDPLASAIICPLELHKFDFTGEWKDGVCLQSSGLTCFPASMVTVLAHLGFPEYAEGSPERRYAEARLARISNTAGHGTEPWQAVRCLRGEGAKVECLKCGIDDVPAPAIIVVYLGSTQHAVAYFGKKDGKYEFGDPLHGRLKITAGEFQRRCSFPGLAYHVTR